MNVIITIIGPIILAGIDIVTLYPSPKIFTQKNMENDPLYLLEIIFMASRANEESKVKSERGKDNWYRKRKEANSNPLTCRTVGWVEVVKDAAGNRTRIELIPDRAAVVRSIFVDSLAGKGQESIVRSLNASKVPCFGKAKQWHKSYIAKILSNPAVIGTYEAHTKVDGVRVPQEPVKGYYPAIVSEEDFYRVQQKRQAHCVKGQKTEIKNILSNLGKCPVCGGTMTRKYSGTRKGKSNGESLVCVAAKVGAGCEYHSVNYNMVEKSLIAGLSTAKITATRPVKLMAEILRLKNAVDERQGQLDNTVDAITAGKLVDELQEQLQITGQYDGVPITLVQVVAGLERDIANYNTRIDTLTRNAKLTQPVIIKQQVTRLRALVRSEDIDRAAINAVLHELCEAVVVDYNQMVLQFMFRFGSVVEIPLCKTI
ncbi:Recombinase zinc beta ribbon domain-containing protein [Trichlorobacter thiogenes]|uniref:Recombinase zinc beta ribbon domain-containing protein n=2 Tax=Trichlorobacter thiogenes TaxID=115783 RepID=A0A1T4KJ28_9BACT|nr:Recombinase zinc beta ribbon domain-containing protein [Trichlorobacter thiogenes]